MPPTIDDYHWLVSPAAANLLDDAAQWLAHESLLATSTKLRSTLSPARAQLVLKQCELRARARDKFSLADRMFFTDVGLQQATGEAVAHYKAARFPANSAILDLCCGIGGDLISLAERGPAIGVDRDEIVALFAAANGRLQGDRQAEARCADVTTVDFSNASVVHIDPDRRPSGRRTTRLKLHEPGDAFLESLISRCAGVAIKLAPACEVPDAWHDRCELEWISHQGECKQLVAWSGSPATSVGRRRATALRNGREPTTIVSNNKSPNAPSPVASAIGRLVYEPDAVVVAARLVDELAEAHALARTARHVAYLTGDTFTDDPLLVPLEVIDVLPFDIKRVKSALRARKFGQLEVKKRGVDASPEDLRRKLKVDGDEQATLLISPHAGKTVAVIARRVPADRRCEMQK